MPVFKVKGKIEIPFECKVTAMSDLDAASWIKMKSASHIYNEHVASFDEAEVVVGDGEEKRVDNDSCTPGATVFVVVTENEGNPPKLGVFASAAGASSYINSEIDRMKPFYEGSFKKPDPGPEFAEDRQAWWNNEMCFYVDENHTFISYRSEIVED